MRRHQARSDDQLLLERWRAGDASAGSILLRRHADALFLFFGTKVVNPADVEDLVQSTMMACLRARDRIWPGANLRAYVLGTARRVLLRHFRTRRRYESRFEPLLSSVEDVAPGAYGVLAETEHHRLVLRALRTIPLDYQITIELLFWHELGPEEIALVLGISPTTVRTRRLRATRLLRDALARIDREPKGARS